MIPCDDTSTKQKVDEPETKDEPYEASPGNYLDPNYNRLSGLGQDMDSCSENSDNPNPSIIVNDNFLMGGHPEI